MDNPKRREYYKKRRAERKAKGLCESCGKQREPGFSSCSSCRLSRKKYMDRNRESINKRQRKNTKANYEYLSEVKLKHGCKDCGYKGHPAALQFDHMPGFKKVAAVSLLASRSRKRMEDEMLKCEIVCANCHAIRTQSRKAL